MNACKCGSYAINPSNHGRQEGVDLHLCDVCYWRERAKIAREALRFYEDQIENAPSLHSGRKAKEALEKMEEE